MPGPCAWSVLAGRCWCEGRLGWRLLLCPLPRHCSSRSVGAPEQGPSVTPSLRRGAEILYSLALAHARRAGADGRYPLSDYSLLSNARRNLGLFQHHDAIAGTAKEAVAVDYGVRCVQGAGAQPWGSCLGWGLVGIGLGAWLGVGVPWVPSPGGMLGEHWNRMGG